jgi:hypothetical protein
MKFIGYRVPVAALAAVALCAIGVAALSTRAAAVTPERSLAGVKIFSPISVVVKKYGSPDEVRVGATSTNPGGGAGGMGGPGGPPMMGPGGGPPQGGGMPPWMQGGGGGAPPWMQQGGAGGDNSDAGGAPSTNLVTYIYDQNDSGTIEFTFSSDGHVIQIKATGYKGNVRTLKGVTLGMNLADVIGRYGAPAGSTITSNILTMDYTSNFHTTFQLYNKKVVAIVVSAVE